VARRRVALNWTCPECGETVPEPFEICWNCGTDRAGTNHAGGMEACQDHDGTSDSQPFSPPPSADLSAGGLAVRIRPRTALIVVGLIVVACSIAVWVWGDDPPLYVLIARGVSHSNSGRYDLAIRDLSRALEQAVAEGRSAGAIDQLILVLVARGAAYNNAKNFQSAIADYTRAIGLARANPFGQFGLGGELGGYQDRLYFARAFSYIESADLRNALADLDTAIELNPAYVDAYRRRARVHRMLGNLEMAEADSLIVRQSESAARSASDGDGA
jgi:tetratricopeptide (TPR) repeat protein